MVTIPKAGKVVTISLADAENAEFPAHKLTQLGGEFPSWQPDGKLVHWSLGNTHFVYDPDRAERFEDSVKTAKKAADKRKADSLGLSGDTARANRIIAKIDSLKKDLKPKEEPLYKALETEVKVYYAKDMPAGDILLKGARIITMQSR